jgi:hypothetical protein
VLYAPWPRTMASLCLPPSAAALNPEIEKARHARGVHTRTLKKLMSRVYEMGR